jgi:hypothetical protein
MQDPEYAARRRAQDRVTHNASYESKVRAAHYQARYGITLEDYDRMFSEQGGTCALCDKPCATGRRLAVDHCHATGAVRGLLCVKCNSALERVEMPGWATRAETYLQTNSAEELTTTP